MLLDAEPDFEVVAEAGDGVEAVEQALLHDPDLTILDVTMPRLTGLQAARQILAQRPGTRVLVLSMHASEQYCLEAMRIGAAGYVVKSAVDRELVAACRATLRGAEFVCPPEARALVGRAGSDQAAADPLTAREGEIVKLVAEGHTAREIAEALVISEKTVERHKGNVLEKLGLRDRVDLTRYAIRRGLVEP